jgi:hypothetical protein
VKYMLLIYTDRTITDDSPNLMGEYMEFTQGIAASGELVSGEPLQDTDTATSVRVRDGKATTTDGPFVETKEHLGGYYLVDVKDLDRALELAAQIPGARHGGVEVRPLLEYAGRV